MRLAIALGCVAAFVFAQTPAAPAAPAVKPLTVDGSVEQLAVSPDGRWLAAAPKDSAPVLFFVAPPVEASDGEEPPPSPPARRELSCAPAKSNSLAFTRDSKHVVVAPDLNDAKMRVFVFSTETAELVLEIDCSGSPEEYDFRRTQVMDVCAGPQPSTFYIARKSKIELWDAEKKERVWGVDCGRTQSLRLSGDGKTLVLATLINLALLDPTSGESVRVIDDDVLVGQQPEPKRRKSFEVLNSPSMHLGGTSPDGGVTVVGASQTKILDTRKYSSPDADDRAKSTKSWYWVEALDTATGESLWVAPMKRKIDADAVVCAGDIAAVEENGKLRLFDMRTGKSKGKISATKKITAAASLDGETWWYGDEKGTIRRK